MRILHITRIPSTVTCFLLPILEAHRNRGDYVAVSTTDNPEIEIVKQAGYDCFTHQFKHSLNPVNLFKGIFDIRAIIKQNKFDVVICHTPMISMVARVAAWSAGVRKKIYFAHGLPCMPMQNRFIWLTAFLIEWVLGRITDSLLVMNDYDEKLAHKYGLIKNPKNIFRVKGVGVDTNKYHPETDGGDRLRLLKEFDAEWANKIVISVCRLIKSKGIYEYVNAAMEILKERDDVLFLLAGPGRELDNLRALVSDKGKTKTIRILGRRNDIDRLTRVSDVFVLPTYYHEGLPVSILEAMACGRPVVATRHRGCEDEVDDGCTGYLVKPKSVEQLSARIAEILADDELAGQMGRDGRKRAEEEFELSRNISLIMDKLYAAMGDAE